MSRKIDVILSAIDNMSPVIDNAIDTVDDLGGAIEETANSGSKSLNYLKDNFTQITAGLAVAGVAMAGFAQSNRELYSESNRAAVSLGLTRDEFRDLAIETSNVTFPLNEAIGLLELAGKQGLQTKEDMQEFATFWDTLGDASGESSEQLAKGAAGLRAMGIAAGEESQALNAYGIILDNTSIDLVKFNELASRNAELAKTNGLSIDDLAAAYAYMQNELGMTAEMMESQFEKVLESNKEEILRYSDTLGDASTMVQDLADAHGETFGIFDKVRHSLSEMALKYQDQVKIIGDFGTVLTFVNGLLSFSSFVQGMYAAATAASGAAATVATPGVTSFGVAVNASIWPILLIVAAIAALIAIIILVVKNFDRFKKAGAAAIDFVSKAFMYGFDAISKGFAILIDIMLLPFKVFLNFVIAGINNMIKAINILGGNMKELKTFDLSIGDMSISRKTEQTINVNTTTRIDGRAVAKSTASATRRVAATNTV